MTTTSTARAISPDSGRPWADAGAWPVAEGVHRICVGAAAVHGLPVEGRVALYLVAPIAISVAACVVGASRLFRFSARRWRSGKGGPAAVLAACVALLAAVALVPAIYPAAEASYRQVASPRYRSDIDSLIICEVILTVAFI